MWPCLAPRNTTCLFKHHAITVSYSAIQLIFNAIRSWLKEFNTVWIYGYDCTVSFWSFRISFFPPPLTHFFCLSHTLQVWLQANMCSRRRAMKLVFNWGQCGIVTFRANMLGETIDSEMLWSNNAVLSLCRKNIFNTSVKIVCWRGED